MRPTRSHVELRVLHLPAPLPAARNKDKMDQEQNPDVRLPDLWSRREMLDPAEWTELYQLVWRALAHAHVPELANLPMEREEYIQKFFLLKVFETTTFSNAAPHHSGALKAWFRRFLIDELRAWGYRKTDSLDGDEGGHPEAQAVAAELHTHFPDPAADDCRQAEARAATQAAGFLATAEHWVRLYLALHFCPDAEDALPLSVLARRYRVNAYHHRARKLGITLHRDSLTADYGDTLIGAWLVTVTGEPIHSSQMDCYRRALAILCLVAIRLETEVTA
jgi:hypothetical protein